MDGFIEVVSTTRLPARNVLMTHEEIAAVYGMLCAHDDANSEIDLSRLRDVLDTLHQETYPGFSMLVVQDDPITMFQS